MPSKTKQIQHQANEGQSLLPEKNLRGSCPLVNRASPYKSPARPIPHDPYEAAEWGDYCAGEEPWMDYNLFTPVVVGRVIEQNDHWLQDRPRDAGSILEVLFPSYKRISMNIDEIRLVICDAMFIAGYRPYGEHLDADWFFPANEQPH